MPTGHPAELASIRTFPQLVRFLRDEMNWPIETDNFEELTFDYTPEELGIEAKSAAKIQEIKRLRPLSPSQPWGIFFVKFEPKRLPVVALRRILSQVVLKKRASANSAERAVWAADDLLFVSNYAEGDERRISLAHFSQADDRHDLPTLKVLGWDNLNTALHLDAVAETLTTRLAWPGDENDVEAWRRTWRSAFTLRPREVITTSRELSIRLAELARAIRDRINTALAIETEQGPLTKLMKAFQGALIHDLDADGFADMYAQTITYGLLSARIGNQRANTADHLPAQIPVTNPFLKELMETFLKVGGRRGKAGGPGIDFDELGVSEVVELLDDPDTHMEAVVRDFDDKNPQEDPVIHFYELFLKEYDAKKRMQRGVFYTPRPVVSYIVRSVDELLRTEFRLADGFADTTTWGEMTARHPELQLPTYKRYAANQSEPEIVAIPGDTPFVQILDPACGTGTFLVEVIGTIYRTMKEKWEREEGGPLLAGVQERWNKYVPEHLLPRLHGYELLMAPYAIAHLKIGLKLYETGYRFGSDERARIYLTNALEPASDVGQMKLEGILPALAHEAQAVNEVKRSQRFTVVIGNPPYSNFGRLNRNPFILGLLEDYKRGLDERKINLDDDFIKFVRFSQATLEQATVGVLGFITNNVYLEGLTHRQMRQSLLGHFTSLCVLNLHGDQRKKETAPDGSRDENVFDIMQGVAIALAGKTPKNSDQITEYADLWGLRDSKYRRLATGGIKLDRFYPRSPNFFFKAASASASVEEREYSCWWRISDTSEGISGIETKRDHFAIDPSRSVLEERIRDFVDGRYSDAERKERFNLRDNEWVVEDAVRLLRRDRSWEKRFVRCLYRPFDRVWIVYHGVILARDRGELMAGMTRRNLGLVVARQSKEPFAALVTDCVCTHKIVTVYDRSFLFPLYRYPSDAESGQLEGFGQRRANFSSNFIDRLCGSIRLKWTPHGPGDLTNSIGPEDIFHYAYAVFYSPSYRRRYAELLRIDFPRLPLPCSRGLFGDLAGLGAKLVALHLMESPKLDHFITTYTGPKNAEVGRVGWSDDTVWLDAATTKKGEAATAGTIGFRGVPEAVWNFHIGGYQVCEKWLKDRKGRTLSKDDITHYQKIVVALAETIRLMKEIDEVIEQHGGWPAAFAAS
jgi:hypothetical protein